MTVYYVGPGGSDSYDGLSYATRKLTLNGAEDIGLSGGDTVYVAPGTYREQLTCDASGSSGNPIAFIGDVTGAFTDGIGGTVRITGSNNDIVASRSYCVYGDGRTFREFGGFAFDLASLREVYLEGNGAHIHDCYFGLSTNVNDESIRLDGGAGYAFVIERCVFLGCRQAIDIYTTAAVTGGASYVQNCLFVLSETEGHVMDCNQMGEITIRNNTFIYMIGIIVSSLPATDQVYVYNNVMWGGGNSFFSITTADDVYEDYNVWGLNLSGKGTNFQSGGNSSDQLILFMPPKLTGDGTKPVDPIMFSPSPWSTWRRYTDNGAAPSDDLFGMPRPATNGKRSAGAIQWQGIYRETTITRNSSPSALGLEDAGVAQFILPAMASRMTASVYVYREADYTGTLPQLVIKRPGYADITVTDTGAAGQWNYVGTEFTHYGKPEWVALQLVSNNTASSGNYKVIFEDLTLE